MPEAALVKNLLNFGLGVALSVGVFAVCVWMVKHIIKTQKEERLRWNNIIENHIHHNTEALTKVCNVLKNHDTRCDEAHDYQKDEHKEITKTLSETCITLKEQTKGLIEKHAHDTKEHDRILDILNKIKNG
jgi:hypothetical protein